MEFIPLEKFEEFDKEAHKKMQLEEESKISADIDKILQLIDDGTDTQTNSNM